MLHGLAIDISSSLKLELSTAQALCSIIDTPRALTVFLLIKYEEFNQLIGLDIDPCDYQDPQHFADDYLATAILSKSSNLPLGINRKQVAIDGFFSAEAACSNTNERLLAGHHPEKVIKARKLIQKVLGPLLRRDLDFVESRFRFGPGATTGVRGSGSVLSDKFDEEIHLTHGLIPFYRALLGEQWWELQKSPTVVEGNKFTTVPKNAKTDRGICIEPTLNIFGQLGVGALLRNRLTRLGVDLSSQERNQFLASKALDWSLATIDLSAASDSLSWGCVMELLPPQWFELLDLFRSPYTTVEGQLIELEKFSSMGNGFTFELETLVFASVAYSCVPLHDHHLVSVYGDDIIVPQYAAKDVIEVLKYLGFNTNDKKSFLAGSFFESCGTDWFMNQNVRPFYLRQEKGSKIPYTVQIANALRLYSSQRMNGVCCDTRFRFLWSELYKSSPIAWRKCRVPASLGDTGFIMSFDEVKPPSAKHGWQGWVVSHIVFKPKTRVKTTIGRLLAGLTGRDTTVASYGREPRRGFLGAPVTKKTVVFHWSEGLMWC